MLRCIREAIIEDGQAPTLKEIGERFGVNVSTVHHHIRRLIKCGALVQEAPYGRRSYRPR
ncbi:helix-turn-helix domain-containing protein [Streptomyces smyrnaeus]|uniref:Helix-turn-helix domain-containing protein n=1 Tax=Streptomyces smyrnaeus TaxID=1387713 RepID=A0ABS3Y4X0_9ACTN|nr:helix-turn-helix domain-containing protein [Streptomyces smyrnaeus]